ncbi:EAL domain-containing protein [Acidiphilium cryptum]|uniref:EAL domain-containing protein n=1 Tax=Acidiphilium cryptum TaxID=524 RepID=UPI00006AE17E|nr:EAL domain-containing protein [Acidiphilium cryptum]
MPDCGRSGQSTTRPPTQPDVPTLSAYATPRSVPLLRAYSSLAQLDAFRFDAMKIDQSFLRRIRAETDETPILNAIVGMATAIRMPITVEGVETQVQLNHVRRLGAACVQGFYFGQPVNEVGMQGLLARGLTASR